MSALRNFVYATVGPFVGMAGFVLFFAGSQKLSDAGAAADLVASVFFLALGLLAVGYLVRGRDRPWRGRVRGILGLPFAVAGYGLLAAIAAGMAFTLAGFPL